MFPLETLGHEWVPERTPEGAERSEALGAKRRVVRTGSRGTIVSTGKLIECLGEWNEVEWRQRLIRFPRTTSSLDDLLP
jgi:hypothetical protein